MVSQVERLWMDREWCIYWMDWEWCFSRKAAAGGLAAGAMAQFLASPTDLIKVQMQMEGRRRLEGKPVRSAYLDLCPILTLCLSLNLSLRPCLCMSFSLFHCLPLYMTHCCCCVVSLCVSLCLTVCVFLTICLYVSLCLCMCLCVCVCFSLSICLCISLSVCVSVSVCDLSVYLLVFVSFYQNKQF